MLRKHPIKDSIHPKYKLSTTPKNKDSLNILIFEWCGLNNGTFHILGTNLVLKPSASSIIWKASLLNEVLFSFCFCLWVQDSSMCQCSRKMTKFPLSSIYHWDSFRRFTSLPVFISRLLGIRHKHQIFLDLTIIITNDVNQLKLKKNQKH